MRRFLNLLFAIGALSLLFVDGLVHAQEKASPSNSKPAPPNAPSGETEKADTEARRKEKIEFFRRQVRPSRLTFADRPQQPAQFVEEPLIRFDNPASQIVDGFAFLWTDRGRPVAMVKSYYMVPQRLWGRTYVSLATQPLELQRENQPIWTPKEAGMKFRSLENVPRPAAEARLRLPQMREIAKEFQVVDNWGLKNPTDWQLRLLTTPLHRYQVPDEKVVDGALFGYVLTTGPEALILLEARQTDDGLEWQYAVSRFTRFGITFSRDGRRVAEFPRLEEWPETGTYFHERQLLTDYPFKNDERPAAKQP